MQANSKFRRNEKSDFFRSFTFAAVTGGTGVAAGFAVVLAEVLRAGGGPPPAEDSRLCTHKGNKEN